VLGVGDKTGTSRVSRKVMEMEAARTASTTVMNTAADSENKKDRICTHTRTQAVKHRPLPGGTISVHSS
jgi:hypothetical protein